MHGRSSASIGRDPGVLMPVEAMKAFLLAATLVAASLPDVPNPNAVELPDGRWRLTCTGFLNACRATAEAACPTGYEIVDRDFYDDSTWTGTRMTVMLRCR